MWALDPDGWSEYLGVTAGLEVRSSGFELFGSYTWSETTDNWVGAASGSIGASLDPQLPSADESTTWAEGISDFDRPHRATAAGTVHLGPVSASAVYRFESGAPFTPRYRIGVDANGDGSIRNDVAFVPAGAEIDALAADWSCLTDQVDGFATRNSCRGPARHSVDARVQLSVGAAGGREISLVVEGFDLIESKDGLLDDALLLVDPSGSIATSPDGGTVVIPTTVNPAFGESLYHLGRGRMLRFGIKVGGGR